jgi:MraZ protein
MGEFQNTIDDKNRIIIPVKFRTGLGERFVVTRGLDDCLFAYSSEQWAIVSQKVKAMDPMQANVRAFQRIFISGAAESELDKQGRVLIPTHLRAYAKLEKDCVTIGVSDRVEIWSKSEWDGYFLKSQSSFNEIAEQLAGVL